MDNSVSKENNLELSREIFETVYPYTQNLAEIACARHEIVAKWTISDAEIFCFYHMGDHPVGKVDRRGIWEKLKKAIKDSYSGELEPMLNIAQREFTRQISDYGKNLEPPVIEQIVVVEVEEASVDIELTELEAQEFWECGKKNGYLNRAVADTAVKKAVTNADRLHAYSCDWGDHWHIGHPKQRTAELTTEDYYRSKLSKLDARDEPKLHSYKLWIQKRRARKSQV